MRHYEVMIILDPDLEEKTIQPSLEAFLNVIRGDGGTVNNVDIWGRRRMAYEINHKGEGIYVVLDLNATPESVAELDRQLNLNEAIVRTKVTRPLEPKAKAKGAAAGQVSASPTTAFSPISPLPAVCFSRRRRRDARRATSMPTRPL